VSETVLFGGALALPALGIAYAAHRYHRRFAFVVAVAGYSVLAQHIAIQVLFDEPSPLAAFGLCFAVAMLVLYAVEFAVPHKTYSGLFATLAVAALYYVPIVSALRGVRFQDHSLLEIAVPVGTTFAVWSATLVPPFALFGE
jgi:threonine/homoserine efflux transporter RhtA